MVTKISAKLILPVTPFDGQIFIDAYRVKWSYSAEEDLWSSYGYVSDLPLARAEDDPNGPTNGLMSRYDKRALDGIQPYAGGCGFIFKPGTYLKNGVDSILDGDIKIKSNTLDITCTTNADLTDSIRFSIKKEYLDKLCIEALGAKGARGAKGATGAPGRHGVGDGPQGAAGADGVDATEASTLTGVIINDLPGVYDTAVVDLVLDTPSATLEVTKAKIAVPNNSDPASKVVAQPKSIGLAYSSYAPTTAVVLTNYTVSSDAGSLDVIKLPDGWSGDMEGAVSVDTMPLNTLINAIAKYYELKAQNIIDEWDVAIIEFMKQKDAEGRTILMDKANQLAEEAWQAPIEFCLLPSEEVLPPCLVP